MENLFRYDKNRIEYSLQEISKRNQFTPLKPLKNYSVKLEKPKSRKKNLRNSMQNSPNPIEFSLFPCIPKKKSLHQEHALKILESAGLSGYMKNYFNPNDISLNKKREILHCKSIKNSHKGVVAIIPPIIYEKDQRK